MPTTVDRDYYAYSERFFRLLAFVYDPLTFVTFRLREMVVDFAGADMCEKILDVATGTGQQAIAFANRGYDVAGIDMSRDMLERARRKNRKRAVELMFADATLMPFADNCFDVSTVSFALHDMPEHARESVLSEMERVTKPMGRIVIVDYGLPPRTSFTRQFWYAFIRSYEGKYYPGFINTNLKAMLEKHGIRLDKKLSIAMGTIRLLKGTNRKENL